MAADNLGAMQRVIRKRIRHRAEGVDLAADINVVVSVNTGDDDEPRQHDGDREQDPDTQSTDEGSTR